MHINDPALWGYVMLVDTYPAHLGARRHVVKRVRAYLRRLSGDYSVEIREVLRTPVGA